MFFGEIPAFEEILRVVGEFEKHFNEGVNGALAMITIRATNQPTRADSMNATTSASSNSTTRALILCRVIIP